MPIIRALGGTALIMLAAGSAAQNIERVRLTDNDLTCAQIHAEVQQMELAIKLAGPLPSNPVVHANAVPATSLPTTAVPPFAAGSTLIQQAVAVDPTFAALVSKTSNPVALPSLEAQAAQILANRSSMLPGSQRAGSAGAGSAAINQVQMAQLMAASNDPRVRAAAADPAAVAQVTAMMQNPQLAVAAQRAGAAGVNPALIQSQLAAAGMTQQAMPLGPSAPAAPVAAVGLAGFFGALAGGRTSAVVPQTAGQLGAAAVTQTAVQPPAPSATLTPVPQGAAAVSPAPQPSGVAAQAQARKEHLTQLFVGKGCKLSALP